MTLKKFNEQSLAYVRTYPCIIYIILFIFDKWTKLGYKTKFNLQVVSIGILEAIAGKKFAISDTIAYWSFDLKIAMV